MRVTTRFFAQLKDKLGRDSQIIEIDDPARVSDLFDQIFSREPLRDVLRNHLRIAVNEEYVSWETAVHDGDEVVFIPPVAGG